MKNDLLDRLIESREQLGRLKTIDCRMAHERVLVDRNSKLPVAGKAPEIEFQRRGLCNVAKRHGNPACSHTIARYTLENAINILEQRREYGEWKAELNALTNTIHLLDREKGEAEKMSARLIKRKYETAQKDSDFFNKEQVFINQQIAEMERRHRVCGEKIERLKNNILAAVNFAIEIEETA